MKLTLRAFEAIYQECDPNRRKKFMRGFSTYVPTGFVVTVDVPVPRAVMEATGLAYSALKLMASEGGRWDVMR